MTDATPHSSLYAAHQARVMAAFDSAMDAAGADTAVVFSGALRMAFLDDHGYPFAVNPHFAYWLPLVDVTDSYVIYRVGEKPILTYCQPDDYWHALPAAPDPYWAEHFDVRVVRTADAAKAHLPSNSKAPIFIGEPLEPAHTLGIERINPSAALHRLDTARTRKSEYELERMRTASRMGATAHNAAAARFAAAPASEYELHARYLEAIECVDSDLPYHSIVALNENGAILHYQRRDRTVPEVGRSFLIDAGAASAGYASDITRTYCNESGLFNDLITSMDTLQQELCANVRADVDYRELHLLMHRLLATLLVEHRIATGSAEALIDAGITRVFLPHGLGHYLGLQVHDVGGHLADADGTPTERPSDDPNLRLTRSLSADEVLTIEPGLYFIDMLLAPLRSSAHKDLLDWQAIDALKPFGGIRIEDNVRVLDGGQENLTRDAFKAVA
ncbi:MAG: Xaa-Pro dipeptidase [Pseudomonadota bacterium]